MSKKCSNQMQLPPPASRHRGVLVVNPPVPLYDFGNRIGAATLSSLIDETRNAQPLFKVNTICTGIQQLCASEKQMVEMTVRCYGSSLDVVADHDMKDDEDSGHVAFKEIQVVMPKTWTPRMYLGAVCLSIDQNQSVLIESIDFRGRRFISINNIHWLFTDENLNDSSLVASRLILNAAYYNVTGGELSSL